MAEIPVKIGGRELVLKSDSRQWILGEKKDKVDKDGNPFIHFEVEAYFADLQHALIRIADKKLKTSDASTLQELLVEIKRLRTEIVEQYSLGES